MTAVSESVSDDTEPTRTGPRAAAAARLGRARWRDPRIWVGVLLVTGSVLLGARLFAAADDTVEVWTSGDGVTAGEPLGPQALATTRVHFSGDVATAYLPVGEAFPEGMVAARDLGPGELLPQSAMTPRESRTDRELPVVVGAAGAPQDLAAGDRVQVWVVPPATADGTTAPARLVLTDVRVVRAARDSGPLGEAATRQVLLSLAGEPAGAEASERLGGLLTSLLRGEVVLIRTGRGSP